MKKQKDPNTGPHMPGRPPLLQLLPKSYNRSLRSEKAQKRSEPPFHLSRTSRLASRFKPRALIRCAGTEFHFGTNVWVKSSLLRNGHLVSPCKLQGVDAIIYDPLPFPVYMGKLLIYQKDHQATSPENLC